MREEPTAIITGAQIDEYSEDLIDELERSEFIEAVPAVAVRVEDGTGGADWDSLESLKGHFSPDVPVDQRDLVRGTLHDGGIMTERGVDYQSFTVLPGDDDESEASAEEAAAQEGGE